ncbi:protein NUCLEOLAR COMPLEX ASSOCIATED 4 isoform X2 [Euphorbia lathyris]|uniref:protein NUCLEOLAR COMPLEX ASSOCIATED 4 isoform X2 n=1 Tax=Euphorbia lathyris TaxID=212925 RepID=UPI00331444D5
MYHKTLSETLVGFRHSAMAPCKISKTKSKSKSKSLKEVKTLGQQLLSSRTHINNLPLLLNFVSPDFPPQYVLESLLSLHSFFIPLLPSLPSSSSFNKKRKITKDNDNDDDAEAIFRTWLRSKFDEFVTLLINLLFSTQAEEALREFVLDSLMEFVKLSNGGGFNSSIYHKILHNIVHSAAPVDFTLELLASKYFKYIDIRYFTYTSLERLAKTLEERENPDGDTRSADGDDESHSRASMDLSIRKIHYIISHVPPLEEPKDNSESELWSALGFTSEKGESGSIQGLSTANISKKMKLKFTKAWISFLRLSLPVDVYKEVLVTLHQAVIPFISNPLMLCDFLTRSYDIGGVVSAMALSSLFILMTQHGLEYPNFYEKLYALLLPSIFMAKHRAKFFQLLDSCLKSPLLPAYLAAAFAKKLSRLALSVPPSGAVVIIALIHNLLRRHPSINCLVHREDSATDNAAPKGENAVNANNSANRPGIDHFNNGESNPVKSGALRSSLWEIDILRHHYCPPVSRFVLSLENDLTVRNKTTEVNINDFCSSSYATIFGEELRRRVKQVPLAFYKAIPTCLFSESDFSGWTFEYKDDQEMDFVNGISNNLEDESNHAKRQRIECS